MHERHITFTFYLARLDSPILHPLTLLSQFGSPIKGRLVTVALGWVLAGLLLSWNIDECSSQRSIFERDYTVLCKWEHVLSVWAKGARSPVILFITYSSSCNSFDWEVWKNLQFIIKRLLLSKPDLWYRYTMHEICYTLHWYLALLALQVNLHQAFKQGKCSFKRCIYWRKYGAFKIPWCEYRKFAKNSLLQFW